MDTKALRQKILDLAIRGKLVPQDPNDEPASVLLERIREEKKQMVKEGKLKPKDIKNDTIIFKGEDNLHYEKYPDGTVKCIEDEIPFEVPEGWEWTRLGDLAQYKKGPFGSSITKAMFVPDTPNAIKIYEQKNAINKDATLGTYFITPEKFETLKSFEVFPNDIIVSCAGTIGETYVLPENMRKGIINQALMKISLYDIRMLDYYLIYFDQELKSSAKEEGHGIALKNIPPFDVLKKYLVAIPPYEEQQRIVTQVNKLLVFVDAVDDNKKQLEETILSIKENVLDLAIRGKLVPQNPDDEPASVLLEKIRAEKEELIKQGKLKRDKKESIIYKGDDNSYYEKLSDGTVKFIDEDLPFDIPSNWRWERIRNLFIVNPKNDIDDNTSVSFMPMALLDDGYSGEYSYEEKVWKDCKKGFTHFADGDVCFAKISPCFENRKSAYFNKLHNGYGAGTTELYVLRRYSNDIVAEYLLSFVKSEYFISRGRNTFSGVVGQQRVDKEVMLDTFIPLPPSAEQVRINDMISKSFSEIANIEDGIS